MDLQDLNPTPADDSGAPELQAFTPPPELLESAAALRSETVPTPAAPAPAAAVQPDHRAALATDLAGKIVMIGCAAGCPNWNIQEQEQAALAKSLGGVLALYLPKEAGADLPPWIALAMTAGFVFGPRIVMGVPRVAPEPDQEAQAA